MTEVHMAERNRKVKILYVKERRYKSSSGKAYSWQQVYMGINQTRRRHWSRHLASSTAVQTSVPLHL